MCVSGDAVGHALVNAQLSTPGEQSEGQGWAFGLSVFF